MGPLWHSLVALTGPLAKITEIRSKPSLSPFLGPTWGLLQHGYFSRYLFTPGIFTPLFTTDFTGAPF